MPHFRYERQVGGRVAGVDEAGRGPLAGPVVAAALVFRAKRPPRGIDDSKKLTAAAREYLFHAIMGCADVGVGSASVEEIDRVNILQATFLAMQRALAALAFVPDHVLVDGNRMPPALPCPATTIVEGDAHSLSIAAASIVAKVTRDRLMLQLAAQHPGYGWETNMGYGTATHLDGLNRLGITIHHRLSFAPVRVAGTLHVVDKSP